MFEDFLEDFSILGLEAAYLEIMRIAMALA
jgi:hypothetical protein